MGPICRVNKKQREYLERNGNLFSQASRSEYSFTVEDGVVCVIDHQSGRSVTNDADAVIRHIVQDLGQSFPGVVIYQDENKIWDQMIVRAWRFAGFRPLSTFEKEEAKKLARSMRRSPKPNMDRRRRAPVRSLFIAEDDLFHVPGNI